MSSPYALANCAPQAADRFASLEGYPCPECRTGYPKNGLPG
jgi:hypothetical protein